jgi:UDP-N-acetylglucosamine 1-carboxyvinyltransferase
MNADVEHSDEAVGISGGATLCTGEIAVDGSKNSAMPMLAAAAASRHTVEIRNLPASGDVQTMARLIEQCGWRITSTPQGLTVSPQGLGTGYPEADLSQAATIRASYYLVPALLGAYGRAELPWPGGCSIGERAMDQHFKVYEHFGDQCAEHEHGYTVTASTPPPRVEISLVYRSRGATIAALLRAASAPGTSLEITKPNMSAETMAVYNALVGLGWDGHISMDTLRLIPREPTPGRAWTVPGDKIEAGTLACALLITGGTGDITGVGGRDMAAFCRAVAEIGLHAEPGQDRLCVRQRERDREPWAGIHVRAGLGPRDLDADFEPLLMALALTQPGHHVFQDEINHGRHGNLVPELVALGAQINQLSPTHAMFTGPQALHGARVRAGDIRTGAALMIAALAAEGTTTVTGLDQVRRGYADLPDKLASLGARIETQVKAS